MEIDSIWKKEIFFPLKAKTATTQATCQSDMKSLLSVSFDWLWNRGVAFWPGYIAHHCFVLVGSFAWGFPGGSTVKYPPAVQRIQVQSLGWEDPLEEGTATHSSILVWRIPWSEEPGGLQSMGSQRVGLDWATEHVCKWPLAQCPNPHAFISLKINIIKSTADILSSDIVPWIWVHKVLSLLSPPHCISDAWNSSL